VKVQMFAALLLCAALFRLLPEALKAEALEIGERIELPIELPTSEDSVLSLEQLRGKPTLIYVWASWCTSCSKALPWMQRVQADYTGHAIRFLALNVDSDREAAKKSLKKLPSTTERLLVAFDQGGRVPQMLGMVAMPTFYLLSADSRLLFKHEGFSEKGRRNLEEQLARTIAQ
jgi:cytochrome c biogenesis protein CcmG/thiol:disulfide interchange protein DsbE